MSAQMTSPYMLAPGSAAKSSPIWNRNSNRSIGTMPKLNGKSTRVASEGRDQRRDARDLAHDDHRGSRAGPVEVACLAACCGARAAESFESAFEDGGAWHATKATRSRRSEEHTSE